MSQNAKVQLCGPVVRRHTCHPIEEERLGRMCLMCSCSVLFFCVFFFLAASCWRVLGFIFFNMYDESQFHCICFVTYIFVFLLKCAINIFFNKHRKLYICLPLLSSDPSFDETAVCGPGPLRFESMGCPGRLKGSWSHKALERWWQGMGRHALEIFPKRFWHVSTCLQELQTCRL